MTAKNNGFYDDWLIQSPSFDNPSGFDTVPIVMNRLLNRPKLRNRYVVLRHAMGEANKLGIIISNPRAGIKGFGLVQEGWEQVHTSVLRALEGGLLDWNTIIFSSDFLRAKQSAETARGILKTDPIEFTTLLRERWFGAFEGWTQELYQKVWRRDAKDPSSRKDGVESANSVQDRVTFLITHLEKHYSGKTFLLVSHGDTLQILQTGFQKVSASRHRSLPHIDTAEIRELTLAPPSAELAT